MLALTRSPDLTVYGKREQRNALRIPQGCNQPRQTGQPLQQTNGEQKPLGNHWRGRQASQSYQQNTGRTVWVLVTISDQHRHSDTQSERVTSNDKELPSSLDMVVTQRGLHKQGARENFWMKHKIGDWSSNSLEAGLSLAWGDTDIPCKVMGSALPSCV